MKDVKQDLGSEGKTVDRTGRASWDGEPYGVVQPSRNRVANNLLVKKQSELKTVRKNTTHKMRSVEPNSLAYIKEVKDLGFQQIFCSYCNPKSNADTERIIRTIKENLIWLVIAVIAILVGLLRRR